MLVLTRRSEEEIVIDGRIRVKVLSNRNGRVRLGITAPEEVRIERSELANGFDDGFRVPPSGQPLQDHSPLA